jgi:hypothetical protein
MSSETISVLPNFLSYGVIGLGAIVLVLFVVIGGRRQGPLIVLSFVFLSLAIISSGVFLEYAKLRPWSSQGEPLPAGACTDATGKLGIVVVKLRIFNNDRADGGGFTSHGYGEEGRPARGGWLYSSSQISDVKGKTTDYPNKRWGASWDCISGPA